MHTRGICRTIRVASFVVLALFSVDEGDVLAQSRGGAAADAVQLQKGTVEIGGIAGSTLPVTWLRAHANRHLTMGALDVGRVMTGQIGRGPLAGNFELLVEITPVLELRQPSHAFGFTVSPLHMRWNFVLSRKRHTRMFAEASGGMVYTNKAVPVRTTDFNFIDQAGFGLRFEAARHAWIGGYRFQHISNAGRVRPNPGVNFNLVYLGVMFLH